MCTRTTHIHVKRKHRVRSTRVTRRHTSVARLTKERWPLSSIFFSHPRGVLSERYAEWEGVCWVRGGVLSERGCWEGVCWVWVRGVIIIKFVCSCVKCAWECWGDVLIGSLRGRQWDIVGLVTFRRNKYGRRGVQTRVWNPEKTEIRCTHPTSELL